MNRKMALGIVLLAIGIFAVEPLAGQVPQSGPLATPVRSDALDPAAFTEWVDGVEQPMTQKDGPGHVVWTTSAPIQWSGAAFGDSKTPGPRHLRIGFKTPVSVGSVLVRAGGQISLLRPEAPYPGNMADASQWMPAARLEQRQISHGEGAREDYVLWVFPKVTATRALRFTHTAKLADAKYSGWIGGVYVLDQRVVNVAPQAIVSTDANSESAAPHQRREQQRHVACLGTTASTAPDCRSRRSSRSTWC